MRSLKKTPIVLLESKKPKPYLDEESTHFFTKMGIYAPAIVESQIVPFVLFNKFDTELPRLKS